MEILTGFLPAGGQGSRLHPHTLSQPKPMLLMGRAERTLLDLPLETLQGVCGTTFITTHYRAETVEEYVADLPGIRLLRDRSVLGNAGSFVEHYDDLSELDADGSMVIMPADHVFDSIDIESFQKTHLEQGADVTLLTVPRKPYGEYVLSAHGRALEVGKDLGPEAVSTAGIYMVRNKYLMDWAYNLRRDGWSGQQKNITADLVNPAIADGRASVYHLPPTGYWDDAGTFQRYHANNMRLSGGSNVVSSEAVVSPGASLERCVVLGAAVLSEETELHNAIVSVQFGEQYVTRI